MGSSKRQTTGYWYYMGLHMGLCHGPIDAILKIVVGDRPMWSGQRYATVVDALTGKPIVSEDGTPEPITDNEQVYIYVPELFGGKSREGGLYGYLDVMMGAATQGANDYLTTHQGAVQPAYRGMVGLVWRGGAVTANNPYIKPWAIQARRIVKGWDTAVWYAAKATIDLGDGVIAMNPAHIVYEALTNGEWGLGYPTGKIDAASFTTAADTFFAEGMGLCIQWQRQEIISNFIQLVCDHAGAALAEDPRTGLWKLKPIRDDYTLASLPEFSAAAGNVISLDDFDRAGQTEVVNELTIGYTDVATGKDGSVTVHHLANITSQGAIVPQTRSYPGLPTLELAGRIAGRDLRSLSSGLAKVRITVNRSAYGLLPGDVIRFAWPELGVETMALRVGKVDYGNLTDGKIRIDAVEDVFGLPGATYVKPPPIGWVEPERAPQASPAVAFFEVPHRELVLTMGAANAAAVPVDSGYLGAVALRPSGLSLNYELRTKIGSDPYAQVDDAEWTPSGTLAIGITPTTGTINLASAVDLDLVEIGSACLVGSEICRIDAVNYVTASLTVARGCADTVAASWPLGTRVWLYGDLASADATEYVNTETVSAKVITRTTGGELAESLAPGGSVTITRRAAKPYPPGRLRINGAAYPASAYARLTLSWAHRDRLLQQDQLVDESETSIGPEAGTTYTVRVYQQPSTLLHTEAGIVGTSFTYEHELDATLRVEVEAVRSGLTSWQKHAHIIACTGATVIVNGAFATDTDWAKGTGWTIASGVATKAAGTASDLSQAVAFVAAGVYVVEFTVSGYTAGTVRAAFAGGTAVNGTARNANGVYTQDMTALTGNNEFRIVADAAFAGSIDAVRVRRVA